MPQLDVYIICNMLYGVIIIFIVTYMLNINNILMIINLLLRIRKLKMCLDKKYIYKMLKEGLIKVNLKFYRHIFYIQLLKLELIRKYLITEDILDIYILKKILTQLYYHAAPGNARCRYCISASMWPRCSLWRPFRPPVGK